MYKLLSFLILLCVLCLPVAAWAKDYKAKKPPEVYFYWGDNAIMTVAVHPDCSLARYDGFQLTPVFAELMRNIMRNRGVSVSEVSETTEWRDFWIKTNKAAVSPRLFVKVYGDGLLHIHGGFMHKNGPDLRFYRWHGTAPALPYVKMELATSYTNQDAFMRDLETTIAPQINERIDRLLRDLQTGETAFERGLEGKNAQ